jgi:hypothetical protein
LGYRIPYLALQGQIGHEVSYAGFGMRCLQAAFNLPAAFRRAPDADHISPLARQKVGNRQSNARRSPGHNHSFTH